MTTSTFPDPFEQARTSEGTSTIDDQNDPVTMVMGLKDVRKCAHNWKKFQSGGDEVGRIVVPSEASIRDTRQIPFEVDPPEHGAYRKLIEPWFKRPLEEDYQQKKSFDGGSPSDYVDEISVFSGSEKIITSKEFKGGKMTSIFGGTSLNLVNADLAQGTNILDVFVLWLLFYFQFTAALFTMFNRTAGQINRFVNIKRLWKIFKCALLIRVYRTI